MTGSGWCRIGPDPAIEAWAQAALPVARRAIADSAAPWRCGGTWFVGVDALPNDSDGWIAGVDFPWAALPLARRPLHRAQLSTIRRGYPQPSPDESPAAFRFREMRDAAHLDGLLPIGPDRRRMVREPHAWILSLPLTSIRAAPLVVWEGSHLIMARALQAALSPHQPDRWGDVDITDAYQAARSQVFDICPRVELAAGPGEATLLHRHTIHGVAPWIGHETGDRIIAYFRPMLASVQDWLTGV
ncbi:MAG: hypothetical protein ACK4RZ_11060 [Paracoccaceae bacterium]